MRRSSYFVDRLKDDKIPSYTSWMRDVLGWNTSTWTISSLFNEKFDLVFMDVQMQDMDGFAATEAIRQREESSGAHLAICAMITHAMKGDRERCLRQEWMDTL